MNPNIHTENIENGEVTDAAIATFYEPLECVQLAHGYLRVVSDSDGHMTETRIPFEMLEKFGFVVPKIVSQQSMSAAE